MQTPFAPIRGIGGLTGPSPIQTTGIGTFKAPSEAEGKSFGAMLGNALQNVNSTLETAKEKTDGLLNGSMENLHEMTVAGAKSEVMLHLTTQIASKLSSATTTLFQMQL